MNDNTFLAFGDELTKIAFFKKVVDGFRSALGTGWHGTPGNKQTWFGAGMRPKGQFPIPKTNVLGQASRGFDRLTSLGGATKYLPVGGKAMTVLGTGLLAREAFKRHDPTGQERSKTERMAGLAANTVGGLAGAGKLMSMGMGGLTGGLVGGIGGGMLAERLVTSPWRKARERAQQERQLQLQQQQTPTTGVPL